MFSGKNGSFNKTREQQKTEKLSRRVEISAFGEKSAFSKTREPQNLKSETKKNDVQDGVPLADQSAYSKMA